GAVAGRTARRPMAGAGSHPQSRASAARTSIAAPNASNSRGGTAAQGAIAMPSAAAAASGSTGASASSALFTDRDPLANGGELLRPHAEHVAQRVRRLEAPAPLALGHDAIGQRRADAG